VDTCGALIPRGLGFEPWFVLFLFLKENQFFGDKTLSQKPLAFSNDIFLKNVNFYMYISTQKIHNFYFLYKKYNYFHFFYEELFSVKNMNFLFICVI
jgi:hypothetical protein